jgi:hypothetical protein
MEKEQLKLKKANQIQPMKPLTVGSIIGFGIFHTQPNLFVHDVDGLPRPRHRVSLNVDSELLRVFSLFWTFNTNTAVKVCNCIFAEGQERSSNCCWGAGGTFTLHRQEITVQVQYQRNGEWLDTYCKHCLAVNTDLTSNCKHQRKFGICFPGRSFVSVSINPTPNGNECTDLRVTKEGGGRQRKEVEGDSSTVEGGFEDVSRRWRCPYQCIVLRNTWI